MTTALTAAQIAQFHDTGFLAPIRVMPAADATRLRHALETYEHATGGPLTGALRHKSHLLFTWLADVVRDTRVVDVIEALYGPNLLCWSSTFFIKEALSPDFVSWHQDSTYWGLNKPEVASVWLALTPSNMTNGAMEVIPGTHKLDQVPHRDTFEKHNLLTRGQEVMVDVDPTQAVRLTLEPGEMSLHHVRLIHGSPPNPSMDRRIGFTIRYIPTSVRQLEGDDSATLVRGIDSVGAFAHEPRPTRDMDPAALELHQQITARNAKILYRGTPVSSFDESAVPSR